MGSPEVVVDDVRAPQGEEPEGAREDREGQADRHDAPRDLGPARHGEDRWLAVRGDGAGE